MSKLGNDLTKEKVFQFISDATSFGNLGLFIGAGFSMAVLNNGSDNIALSWGELLKKCSEKFDVEYKDLWQEGLGYPEIASRLCKKYSEKEKISYEEALRKLKNEIANMTSWYPDKDAREEFSLYLKTLNPSWIITTNYDLVIESLLTGKATSLGTNAPLISPSGTIPVYHLHGIRYKPEDIIISQEDYVSLFRPSEYRQIKLALTISESTTLLLGYGLGDVNVLTALDWSKNVFKKEGGNYPHEVIQLIKSEKPHSEPYRDKNGIVIIETDDLRNFFSEYLPVRKILSGIEEKQRARLEQLAQDFNVSKDIHIKKFIENGSIRKNILQEISRFPVHLSSEFLPFLNKCLDETWSRSKPAGEFEGYNENLSIILDILTTFDFESIPPALFETTTFALQRVGFYVGRGKGQSWSASKTWQNRKNEISQQMANELSNFAKSNSYMFISKMMKEIQET